MSEFKKISFVIPCYRSENTINIVIDEIEETLAKRPEFDYEVICVNDGSPDNVWAVIKERAKSDHHLVGVNLAKNFGQHSALMAGYNHVSGDCVVSLDDDGQTPACDVFQLLEELEKGYDIVYATYPEVRQNWFRRWGSMMAKRMSDYMFDVHNDIKASSYFIARRFLIDEMIRYTHSYPYLVGLVLRSTRNFSVVPLQHRARLEGTSGYTLKSLISLWLNGFTAFSVKPLELGAYMGFAVAAFGFIFAIVTIVRKILTPTLQAGWSSTISAIMIIGGAIMLMLGLIGEYIGRIYISINNSPQYVIREVVSVGDENEK